MNQTAGWRWVTWGSLLVDLGRIVSDSLCPCLFWRFVSFSSRGTTDLLELFHMMKHHSNIFKCNQIQFELESIWINLTYDFPRPIWVRCWGHSLPVNGQRPGIQDWRWSIETAWQLGWVSDPWIGDRIHPWTTVFSSFWWGKQYDTPPMTFGTLKKNVKNGIHIPPKKKWWFWRWSIIVVHR